MISDIDKDGSGTIDFEEFLQMMTAKMGERDSREEIMKAFRLFDDDETGKISFKNLKRVAKELGENMTDEELMEMIEEVRSPRCAFPGKGTCWCPMCARVLHHSVLLEEDCFEPGMGEPHVRQCAGRPGRRWGGQRGGVLPNHEEDFIVLSARPGQSCVRAAPASRCRAPEFACHGH